MTPESLRERISREVAVAVVAVALVAVALLGYFALIAPKRAEAADLESQIAATRQVLEVVRSSPKTASAARPKSDLRRIARAMPQRIDMARVVLDLNRLARKAGVRLDGITPQPAVTQGAYQAIPIELTVRGRFFGLTSFLRSLRTQATVKNGEVKGPGRLYSVEGVSLLEGEPSFPQILAAVRISTFFGATVAPAAGSAAQGTTTGTTTTETAASAAP